MPEPPDLLELDRRRQRLGWSIAKLGRESGVGLHLLYKATASLEHRRRIDVTLTEAEQTLISELLTR